MSAFFLFIAVIGVIIDLASPVTVYGVQLFLFPFACLFLYAKSVSKMTYQSLLFIIMVVSIVIISSFIQVYISQHNEILLSQTLKVIIWVVSSYLLYVGCKGVDKDTLER